MQIESNGPFQAAHGTTLPFFDWLVATPPHTGSATAPSELGNSPFGKQLQ